MALGGYGTTAITALTAQNTLGVLGGAGGIYPVPADFVRRQMEAVLDDIGADAIKTGMLVDASIIEAVAAALAAKASNIPLVLDPVMISKSGAHLLQPAAVETLKRRLIPQAAVLTPNIPEAEALLGHPVTVPRDAAYELLALGPKAVLLKGGHWPPSIGEEGDAATDILAAADGVQEFTAPRLAGPPAHGTGCALASAIATGLAQGMGLAEAVGRAKDYVREAIKTARALGGGHPVLNHGWEMSDG